MRRREVPVILLVDDTALVRRAIAGILKGACFEVHEAATGSEALDQAAALKPDLIMLDIELPDIGGLEVARRLKEGDTTSRIPVIHLSATKVSRDDLVRGLDAGADAYLAHPVDPGVLLSTIRAQLRMKSTVERVAALQALTAALSSAGAPAQVAVALLDHGLFAAGASAGALATASKKGEGGWLDIVKTSPGWPPALSGDGARISMATPGPLSVCAWIGQPQWISSHDAFLADYPHLAASELGALACLPLSFDGRVCGAVGFSFASATSFSEVNRSFLFTIATECAHALERIHLQEAERRAREKAERAAEQEREARLEQARVEAALRLSIRAREDMLAIVSHDLRSPLSAIILNADLAMARMAGGQLQHAGEAVDNILALAERMNVLIGDLLDAACIESGLFVLHLEPCPVDAMIDEIVGMLAPLAKKKSIALNREVAGLAVADCDYKRVLQILSNLVGNAIKFTPSEGTITVRAVTHAERVVVSVSDTGRGVGAAEVPHLFDRYWKGHARDSGGAGLGLFIVKGIVEAHGGRIGVESQLGVGTSFSFDLPLHRPREQPAV